MKKIIFTILFTLITNFCFSQVWVRKINIDTYTQEKTYYCSYRVNNVEIAAYFPDTNIFGITKYYEGIKYNDILNNAYFNNNGKISYQNTTVTARYIFNNNYKEYDYKNVNITFSIIDVDAYINNIFQSFIIIDIDDEDLESLKKGKSISFKWYDKIEYLSSGENYLSIINISLIGFTKCYNSCINIK
jgi:hypothetical protein